ncbi:MAG TPA: FG-GAP-like repeat-containing protein [Pyrinomonadaceae bacterium]
MKSRRRFTVIVILVSCALFILSLFLMRAETRSHAQGASSAQKTREEAYRANNLGVALLEQFKHREGAAQFRRALQLDPQFTMARINLAIALLYVPDAIAARKEAQAAIAAAPDAPQPHYVLGLIAKTENKPDEAVASFQRVLKLDPRDVGANVQLGQLYAQQRKYPEAIAAFRVALEEEPYNGTALYNLGTALLRGGQREEGQRLMQQFQALRQSGAGTTIGQGYLEQGRYAEAISSTGAEPEVVDRSTPEVVFTNATQSIMPAGSGTGAGTSGDSPANAQPAGGAVLFDFDGDGDLDIFGVGLGKQQLYRNDGGKLTDVTKQSGALGEAAKENGVGAVAGDFDNDEKPDLFVLRNGSLALYRNEGGGRFADVTTAAQIPKYPYTPSTAAFVDADHDGDLDIFVAAGASDSKQAGTPNLLLRNNGNSTFTDVTAAARLNASRGIAVSVVPTDYDNRRDVDLLIAYADAPPALWKNLRDGTFRNVAAEVGLDLKGRGVTTVAAGDLNKDGFTDFYFGHVNAPGDFALSDGKGRFKIIAATAPSIGGTGAKSASDVAAQLLDYDNDGLLDLLAVTTSETGESGLRIWRNVGDGWADVSDKATRSLSATSADAKSKTAFIASGDVDNDGDVDLILAPSPNNSAVEALTFARNDGGNKNRSVRVRLAGKVSNRSGVGAKIEARAGSLRQRLETYAAMPAPAPADVVLGLGQRAGVDAVRVLWPAGIVQTETEIKAPVGDTKGVASSTVLNTTVTELDRKPSSCPYLYAWNGERFEFVTDFMGGGELGYWAAPGVRAAPDSDEYVRIRGDQLREQDGRYLLRVTNELEEALFLDAARLIAITHPSDVEVFPNEGLGNPTSNTFKLYTTRGARPPAAASDEHGHDVLAKIATMDRQYPDDFKLHRIRGYAEEHSLVLNPGGSSRQSVAQSRGQVRRQHSSSERMLLLMTGWTDYAFSSDNVAASQSGMSLKPPALQVKDKRGQWQTVIADIGIPVGRPQTVVVDLTGKFLSPSREVRIVTNMRIYWDQILVDTSSSDVPFKLTNLQTVSAELRWRGFSAEITPDGREPFSYDYARISLSSPWKVMPGRYTREGNVGELLQTVDDMFVISRPGDEVSLSFDATGLPPLSKGWTRTFLLYADGYSKEMDINSASPDQVAPLPFHGMKNYPYDRPIRYPMTAARRAYIENYNTRVVAAPLSKVESYVTR